MKVGDKVAVRDDCDVIIEEIYVRHGIVSSIIADDPKPGQAWYIVKFADGVVENYRDYELDPLTDKEYFQRQLKG